MICFPLQTRGGSSHDNEGEAWLLMLYRQPQARARARARGAVIMHAQSNIPHTSHNNRPVEGVSSQGGSSVVVGLYMTSPSAVEPNATPAGDWLWRPLSICRATAYPCHWTPLNHTSSRLPGTSASFSPPLTSLRLYSRLKGTNAARLSDQHSGQPPEGGLRAGCPAQDMSWWSFFLTFFTSRLF